MLNFGKNIYILSAGSLFKDMNSSFSPLDFMKIYVLKKV